MQLLIHVLVTVVCICTISWLPCIHSGQIPTTCVINSTRAEPGSDCQNYQVCNASQNYSTARPCPRSLMFNEDMGWCDFPFNVDNTTCRNGSSESPFCTMGRQRATPDSNCTMYETCLDGMFNFSRPCPLGTLWNVDVGVCDFEEWVDITNCTTLISSKMTSCAKCCSVSSLSRSLSLVSACTPGDGIANVTDKCKTYQICTASNEYSEPLSCPGDTGYAVDLQQCVEKIVVSNKDCTIRPIASCTPGSLNATADCEGFKICNTLGFWNSFEYTCPVGTLYNENITRCEYENTIDNTTCLPF